MNDVHSEKQENVEFTFLTAEEIGRIPVDDTGRCFEPYCGLGYEDCMAAKELAPTSSSFLGTGTESDPLWYMGEEREELLFGLLLWAWRILGEAEQGKILRVGGHLFSLELAGVIHIMTGIGIGFAFVTGSNAVGANEQLANPARYLDELRNQRRAFEELAGLPNGALRQEMVFSV